MVINHGGALEADLCVRGVDLLDFYRANGRLTARRLVVLIDHLLLEPGTATARAVHGELGDWTRLDLIVGGALGAKIPESRQRTEWKRREQERIKARRAEIEAARRLASTQGKDGPGSASTL